MPELLLLKLDRLIFRRIIEGVDRFTSLAKEMFEWRLAQGKQDDLFGALLEAKDSESEQRLSTAQLVSEAGLLIIAGSDTTITAMTATVFYLLHFPSTLVHLQAEIRKTFADVDEICIGDELSSCRYLHACINEAMRLTPSIGSTLMREILPGGLVIDGQWFPPGTDVGVPHYALHHDEEHFPDPFNFKPERWLKADQGNSSADSIADKLSPAGLEREMTAAAFTPFGVGRTSCIGRYLAYQEMLLTVASIVRQYDMRLQPGSSTGEGNPKLGLGRQRINEFQTLDRFVSMHEGPIVQFRQAN